MSHPEEDDAPIDRSLLDAALPGLEPKAADRARVRRAVLGAIATGAAGAATSTAAGAQAAATGAAGATTAAVGLGLGAKIVVGVIAVASVVGVVAVSRGPGAPRRSDSVEPEHASAPVETPVEVTPPSAPVVATAPPLETAPTEAAPTEAALAEAAPTEAARPSSRPRAEPDVPEVDPIFAETELLARARAAVDAHDGQTALDLLAEHAHRFPGGELRQERLATRILALCELGQTERAHREAAAFLDVFPGSVHAAHVREAACWPTPAPSAPTSP